MKNKDQIQDEALRAMLPFNRCGAGITMGGGKTLLGLKHMSNDYTDYSRFLVVAPKVAIQSEWKSQAKQFSLSHLLTQIDFTTYLSLNKKDLSVYDVIYLDECHSLLYSHKPVLSKYKGKIVGLTGTPPIVKTSEKYKMVEEFCPIVYTYETEDAVDDKILNDYSVHIHMLSLSNEQTLKTGHKNGASWYTSEKKTYDYWTRRCEDAIGMKEKQIMSVMRMKALMQFPSKEILAKKLLSNSKEKTVLFANTKEQADSFGIPTYHSSNKQSENNLNLFKKGDINQLACVLQLNEGVNIPQLKEAIIMHSYGNERKTAQRLGRILRLLPHEKATVHILCYRNTVDEKWVMNSIQKVKREKIHLINH